MALGLVNRLLWNALVISAPVLGAALAVGLAISVLQVATQLQEMTLTYVPKMLVVVLALIALGPWMLHQLTQFATAMMRLIPAILGVRARTPFVLGQHGAPLSTLG